MPATRVAILGHTAQLGGAEIALLRLVDALPETWSITVVLFSHGALETELLQRGVAVEVMPLAAQTVTQGRAELTDPRVLARSVRDSAAFTGQLAHRLSDLGAELVVANSLKAAVLGSIAARRARLPWVWHLHDRLSSDYLPAPVVTALRMLGRTARHVVANSQQTARLTRLPPRRVSVAYPGLPEASFTQEHPQSTPPVFGLLGRISSTKGQLEFVQAAALVAVRHPTAEFHIVGEALFNDQDYAEHVRKLPKTLGIDGRVRFLGWTANPAQELDRFTALVHASPVPEPFGQVIVEAMARKVPVIATVGGGVAEILTEVSDPPTVEPGNALRTANGQLVAPQDPTGLAAAMNWVLDHPAEASILAQTAAESAVRRFSIASTAAVCTAVWKNAIAGHH
ncbi:glycosyltransferase family 4 protein [Nesterenkonia salmonea]|uniref:Glycosyltransferase family 4 protein n=1 Tax=Nesterenkonia salmonea TaxID=1804987 RepID=A0A5R9BCH0_9MICC|nr:glycosyltransferase family 4 protein [Nesterenkonia salmonea]TLP97050.1 glycosyltransferase family 4 protein [Nesterenkonia salmonea]